ncbi:MAG: RND family transporter, partial [Proteobacteria bacterium]|nr:RND family transporter [Pseudomonadota bacterium]
MFITNWSETVINNRGKVILITLSIMLLSIIPMKNLHYDNSNELFFLPGDPNLVNFDLLQKRFGDNEYLMVGVEARSGDRSIFLPDTLKMISKLTNFFEDHEVVTKVTSLTKYQYVHAEDDSLTTSDLIEDID